MAATSREDPSVSIVTAVRNGMPFVADTIASVLAQSYRKIEYIVVDGQSTDGTLEVIRRSESRLAKWLSEPDGGIANAFNKGLRLSTGDYLMFLNSDDWLADRDAITRLVEAARARDWPHVIYGDCDLYDRRDGRLLYRASIPYSRGALLRGAALPHPGLLTSRAYFARYGEFDESFRIAMDLELFLRGVPRLGADHVPVLVTNIRSGGLSTRDRRLAVEETFRALDKNGHLRSELAKMRLRGYYFARYLARRALESLGLRRSS